ncbi:MAG: pantoate--beta-alanine ligase [Sulfurospirillaceae bacterium]|nr:pantoate--beta-alanine ligase [Sulfurospirillaceae bacterium]
MKIFHTPQELQEYRKTCQGSVGFVPTMGALHNGHISLIKKSVVENEQTIVSIFVNPTQFLATEDLSKYPKRTQADLKICSLANVDAVFMPEVQSIYFPLEPTIVAPFSKAYILEGLSRAGHFDGVLRVVLKLFNLTRPDRAYFGKKDAQQLYLIQNMVKTLFLPIDIIACDIIREEDGLALSSRNIYLSNEEKKDALLISKSLKIASKTIMSGERKTKEIAKAMRETLLPLHVEYVEILSREFEPLESIEIGNTIILVAVKVGTTRLIDNIWI